MMRRIASGPQSGQSGSIFTPQLSSELIVFRSHVCRRKATSDACAGGGVGG